MKLKNTTDFPDHFLRRMVAFCCRELELPSKAVREAAFRRRSDGFETGHAWPQQMRFVVSVGDETVWEECPQDARGAYQRLDRDQTTGAVRRSFYCRDVAVCWPDPRRVAHVVRVVLVTAHELSHLEQARRGRRTGGSLQPGGRRLLRNGGSEANTDHLAGLVVRAFEARRAELLAAWSREPARTCARAAQTPTLIERRAAKAAADLARWARKLKLAQTKVRQYKARVAYYEKKSAN